MVRSDAAPSKAGASDSTRSGAPSPREMPLPGARRPFALPLLGASAAGEHRPFCDTSGGQGSSGAGVRSPFVSPGRSHSPTALGVFLLPQPSHLEHLLLCPTCLIALKAL